MASHVERAQTLLGVRGTEDPALLWQHYVERLGGLQERLIRARTEPTQRQLQSQLAQLVAAYEILRAPTDAHSPVDRDARTRLRTAVEGRGQVSDVALRPLERGSLLQGRYLIEGVLGDGGMGCVYAARDRLKDEQVAIKVLRSELVQSTSARGRFLSEAKVSCRLAHPNIVRVFDVGIADGRYFFTMERLKGVSLRQRIQAQHASGTAFPLGEATVIAEHLLAALRYAHQYIVHRDLKPENVWIDDAGVVKLMDFGVARAFASGVLTRTGMHLGTAYYMAPEQHADAKEVDWRADQYAFGVLMYELLTGRVPMGAVRPLEQVRRDIPRHYARAIMRALSPRPEDRFPSLQELESVLVSRRMEDAPGALLSWLGRSVALGTIAGAVFAYFDSMSLSRIHELMYPVAIAAGIGTAFTIEFCESFFRSRFKGHSAVALLLAVVWITMVLFVAQRQSGLSHGLVVMLCASVGASATDYVTRRWRVTVGWQRLEVAFIGSLCGSLFGMLLLATYDPGVDRNYWLTALSGLLPGMIISIASLRRRLWSERDEPERANGVDLTSLIDYLIR